MRSGHGATTWRTKNMNKYKVESTQGATTRTTIIEANSIRDAQRMITQVGKLFEIGLASIGISKCKKYTVSWTDYHGCVVEATSEAGAIAASEEYASKHNTVLVREGKKVAELDTSEDAKTEAMLTWAQNARGNPLDGVRTSSDGESPCPRCVGVSGGVAAEQIEQMQRYEVIE